MKVAVRILVLMSLAPIAAAKGVPVHVIIDFADREDLDIAVTYEEAYELTGVKQPYDIEFWVIGAFAKAKLDFKIEKDKRGKVVTSIQGVANDSTSQLVYFVNGFRSKWHIDNQSEPRPRTIRFKYEAR
jgi:hypothetical protein